MLWRAPYGGARFAADKGEPNRRKLRALVRSGRPVGCLAWRGGEAVGWVSVGPRASFAYFERSRVLRPAPGEERVWSITCFYVPARSRGQGVASALLAGAVRYAREQGARHVEGYPVPAKGGAQQAAAFVWTGLPQLFAAAGFRPLERPAGARPVYRLSF